MKREKFHISCLAPSKLDGFMIVADVDVSATSNSRKVQKSLETRTTKTSRKGTEAYSS